MSSLLERMEEGFDSFFEELNNVSTPELIEELENLGLLTDVSEDVESFATSISISFGVTGKIYQAPDAKGSISESFDELKYAA